MKKEILDQLQGKENVTNNVMSESEIRKQIMDKLSSLKKIADSQKVILNLSNGQSECTLFSYKCPICGKEYNIQDCIIVKQDTQWKFLNRTYNSELSTYRLKVYDEHYQVKYYNVRICKDCASKRKRHFIYAALFVILGLVALIVRNIIKFPQENFSDFVSNILLALIPGGILGAFIYFVLCVLIAKSHKIDVEKAKQNNAIAPADSF